MSIRRLLLTTLCFLVFSCDSGPEESKSILKTLRVDGLDRTYILQIPSAYSESEELPLIIGYHGFGADQSQLANLGFDIIADVERFISVFPQGIENAWNVTSTDSDTVDDLAFTDAIIQDVDAGYKIDSEKIFAFGFSNGGFMAQRLACDRPGVFRGIASVAGSITREVLVNCSVSPGTSVLAINSLEDQSVRYTGSTFSAPIDSMMSFWRDSNDCQGSPTVNNFTSITQCSSELANVVASRQCGSNAEVDLIQIQSLPHAWPCWSAVEIWNFFDRQR